jgi:hypothetical protein
MECAAGRSHFEVRESIRSLTQIYASTPRANLSFGTKPQWGRFRSIKVMGRNSTASGVFCSTSVLATVYP